MKNFIRKLLGIDIASVDDVVADAKDRMQQQHAPVEENPVIGYLTFKLLKDGNMSLQMDWADDSVNAGSVFGEFLYRIHSGKFKKPCFELLLSAQNGDIRRKPFVEACTDNWSKFINEDDKDEDSLITPMNVFGMSRISPMEQDE